MASWWPSCIRAGCTPTWAAQALRLRRRRACVACASGSPRSPPPPVGPTRTTAASRCPGESSVLQGRVDLVGPAAVLPEVLVGPLAHALFDETGDALDACLNVRVAV